MSKYSDPVGDPDDSDRDEILNPRTAERIADLDDAIIEIENKLVALTKERAGLLTSRCPKCQIMYVNLTSKHACFL